MGAVILKRRFALIFFTFFWAVEVCACGFAPCFLFSVGSGRLAVARNTCFSRKITEKIRQRRLAAGERVGPVGPEKKKDLLKGEQF